MTTSLTAPPSSVAPVSLAQAPSRPSFRHVLTKKIQKVFWIYLTDIFEISRPKDLVTTEPGVWCSFSPVTLANCSRVLEFRDQSRAEEYRDKIAHDEIGFFVESGDRMVGSIWATVNATPKPICVRTYIQLEPNEALIHDIVTADNFRGMGIGPYMVTNISSVLLREHGVSKIIIDVNVRNRPSLRMMSKAGLPVKRRVLHVSALGKLVLRTTIRQFSA